MIECKQCGSTTVQTVTWVEINSQQVHDTALSQTADAQDNWCPRCEANVDVVHVSYSIINEEILLTL